MGSEMCIRDRSDADQPATAAATKPRTVTYRYDDGLLDYVRHLNNAKKSEAVNDEIIAFETEDTERDPPTYVEFVGRSKVMRVTGQHTLEETDDGCRLTNEFVVDGKLPGVERFFKKNLDSELENLERSIRDYLDQR